MPIFLTALTVGMALLAIPFPNAHADDGLDRTKFPIQAPVRPAITELDARKAKAPPPFRIEAPKGVPNVLVVLIDDIGCFPCVLREVIQKGSPGGTR
jgi:hypothetical protein